MRALLGVAVLLMLAGCSNDRAERLAKAGPNPSLDRLLQVASPDAGRSAFGQCAACHTVGEDAGDRGGPNLHAILGKPVAGASPGYSYTAALKAKGGKWTPEAMDAWLASPARAVPGTKMFFPGVPDPMMRADIIAFLKSQGE